LEKVSRIEELFKQISTKKDEKDSDESWYTNS
jgi:hypothetical protein